MNRRRVGAGTVFGAVIAVIICIYIAIAITNSVFPQPQFTVDLAGADNQIVTVYTYHNQGTAFPMETEDGIHYAGWIPSDYRSESYHLRITVDPAMKRILAADIDGKNLSDTNIIHIVDKTEGWSGYLGTVILTITAFTQRSVLLFALILVLLLSLSYFSWKQVTHCGFKNRNQIFVYNGSALSAIGWKPILVSILIALLTISISVGVDMDVFVSDINLHYSGVDLYQLAATCNQRFQIELAPWPYNLPMLIFYAIGTLPTIIGTVLFKTGVYHVGYYFIYKLVNIGLLMATVLSVLSFLIDHQFIDKKSCKAIFYWSVLNPVTFYIAVIYIQLDVFPVYCLALGTLLLVKKQTPVLAGILLAIGISCKQQVLLLLPIILIIYAFILWRSLRYQEHSMKVFAEAFLSLAVVTLLFLGPNFLKGTPLHYMMLYTPQSERAWWTTLQYAPAVFLFITLALLILVVLLNLFHMRSAQPLVNTALNSLYMYGVIVLVFSFSILSTPSTLLHCTAAFTLCYAATKDNIQRFIIAVFGLLMVFEIMFTHVGDVLALLALIGVPYTFTALEQSLANTAGGVRWISILFTVSHTAMLTYAVLFYKKATRALVENNDNYMETLP